MDINNAYGMTASSLPAAAAATVPSGGHPLELMLGMAYNATTGRLSVEVVQGCNIKSPDSQKPPGNLSRKITYNVPQFLRNPRTN